MTFGDQSYWQYGYDYAGQVNSGKRYWSDNDLVSGQQYEYSYDGIGNRLWTKLGGDSSGDQNRINNYTPDNLNHYSLRTVPGVVDVLGEVDDLAEIVRVNWNPTWRKGKYYHAPISVENTYKGSYAKISVETTQNTVEGYIQVPPLNQSFTYDSAGNMTNDGIWTYTWDADNRLVGMARNPAISVPSNVATNIIFTYDWQGRRIRKQTWSSGNTVLTDRRYVYDGWRLMAEYSAVGSQTTDYRTYVWGLDLSGTMDGAGGVGGLLMINDAEQGAQYVCYDGNGNVAALVNAVTGVVTARYEYSPFGELIRMTGPMSRRNPFRFSTKYTDDETDLVYYGYRYYSPNLGRWISRDPIGEDGGVNLYAAMMNCPLNFIDSDGYDNIWHRDIPGNSLSIQNNPPSFKLTITPQFKEIPPPKLAYYLAPNSPRPYINRMPSYEYTGVNILTIDYEDRNDPFNLFLNVGGIALSSVADMALDVPRGLSKWYDAFNINISKRESDAAFVQASITTLLLMSPAKCRFKSNSSSTISPILEIQKELSLLANKQGEVIDRWLKISRNKWAILYRSIEFSEPNAAALIRGKKLLTTMS